MNTHSLAQVCTLSFAALLLVSGCDDGLPVHGDHAPPPLQQVASGAAPSTDAGRAPEKHIPPQGKHALEVKLADPDVTIKIASTASGTSCPKADIYGALSSDGSELLAQYGFNELETDRSIRGAERSCTSRFTFETSAPVQYSVTRLIAQGSASFEAGATGRASYSVRDGAGELARTQRDFTGPVDQNFRIDEPVGTDGERWSPCSRGGQLEVLNGFRVRNPEGKAAGWLDMCDVDVGNYYAYLALKLAWRSCTLPE